MMVFYQILEFMKESVFPKWKRKQCDISLVLKSRILRGCQSDLILFVLKRVGPAGEGKEISISLGVLNRV